MKLYQKVLLVVVIFFVAIGILFLLSQKKSSNQQKAIAYPTATTLPALPDAPVSQDAVVASLQTFDVTVANMPASIIAKNKAEFESAKKQLNEAVKKVAANGVKDQAYMYWPLETLGHINRDMGNYDKADSAYRLAMQISPESFVPYGDLGELNKVYYKDYPKAVNYYLHAASIDSAYVAQYYYELYQLYRYQLSDIKQAENILIQGVQKYPKVYDILADLALYYRDTNQIDKAIARYKELLAKDPQSDVAQQALTDLQK